MAETGAYYTEWSKPERKTPIQYTNAYILNLEKWEQEPCMWDSKRDSRWCMAKPVEYYKVK